MIASASGPKASLPGFEGKYASKVKIFNQALAQVCANLEPRTPSPGLQRLYESMLYSLQSGGKRFRPVLALLVGEALQVSDERVLAFAVSLEMVHTYSLIHDDLPCMDNDDFRRGEPTNHNKFGEATALLAGDALLTEAFLLLAISHREQPEIAIELVQVLAQASGMRGMIGGQMIDLVAKTASINENDLRMMHQMKTGALIASAVEGVVLLAKPPQHEHQALLQYGGLLGLAFQLADDLLDSSEQGLEPGSFPALLGLGQTRELLRSVSAEARDSLAEFGDRAQSLRELIDFNESRSS